MSELPEPLSPPIPAEQAMLFSGFTAAVLHPLTTAMALVGFVMGAFFLPVKGFGVSTCGFLLTTGLPCPGCGLTRSVTCALNGLFASAWAYNPFGLVFALFFAGLGPLTFLPASWRRALVGRLARWDGIVGWAFVTFCVMLVGYGLVRAGLVFVGSPDLQWWRTGGAPSSVQ